MNIWKPLREWHKHNGSDSQVLYVYVSMHVGKHRHKHHPRHAGIVLPTAARYSIVTLANLVFRVDKTRVASSGNSGECAGIYEDRSMVGEDIELASCT
jgi:hypothetical protein